MAVKFVGYERMLIEEGKTLRDAAKYLGISEHELRGYVAGTDIPFPPHYYLRLTEFINRHYHRRVPIYVEAG